MFLIEYEKGRFVDGESIYCIDIENGAISFRVRGFDGSGTVGTEYQQSFINQLQALNQSGYLI